MFPEERKRKAEELKSQVDRQCTIYMYGACFRERDAPSTVKVCWCFRPTADWFISVSILLSQISYLSLFGGKTFI